MNLADIGEAPRTPEELAQWSFAHAVLHRDIDATIFRLHGVTLPSFVLDPFDPRDASWFYLHQASHDARNAVLKIQGQSFTNADWSSEGSMLDWINRHAAEEQYAAQLLNIG